MLTSVKDHGNLYILIPLNQRLALTRLRATGPSMVAITPLKVKGAASVDSEVVDGMSQLMV